MTYNKYYTVQVSAVNLCGSGYRPVSLTILTEIAPSPPLVAYQPVLSVLTAPLIQFIWPAIASSEDITGGYDITGYNLYWSPSPSNSTSFTLLSNSNALTFQQTSGWLWNNAYDYKVCGVNQLGNGVNSTILTITTPVNPALCTLPTGMWTPTLVSVTAFNITISWQKLADSRDGGDIPIFYSVDYSSNNSSWSQLNAGGPLVNLNTTTIFYYSHIVSTVFSSGSSNYYRIRAQNNVGLGTPSVALLVIANKVPQGMTAISLVSVYPMNITMEWSNLTDMTMNGGDIPIFYSVEWSSNNSTWTQINQGGILSLIYTQIMPSPYSSNSYQYYRVRAQNHVGMGSSTSYSNILQVKCDDVPEGMNTLTLVAVHPTNITISWLELTNTALNGRDLPIFYSVEYKTNLTNSTWTILNAGGDFALNYTHVLGGIFNENLTYMYRVRAENNVGMSNVYSAVLTATPCTTPLGMNAPILNSVTTQTVSISWSALTNMVTNGGDIPSYYAVEFSPDNINWTWLNNNAYFTLSYSNSPSTILTDISFYRVRAQNGVGMSSYYSSVLKVTAPGNYTPVVCTIHPANITVCWNEASTQWGSGAYPTSYQLEWLNPSAYGSSCSQVPVYYQSMTTNHTSNSNSLWQVVSPTTVIYNWQETHFLSPGIFPDDVFPSGSNQCYRVRMLLNGVLSSIPSNMLVSGTNTVPQYMNEPSVIEIHPYNISLQWDPIDYPQDGGDPPIFYLLEWIDTSTGKWTALTNIVVNGLVLNYTHVRPSVFNESISLSYRVTAQNGVGMGTPSVVLVVNPDTQPTGMDSLDIISVNPFNITIGWPECSPQYNGGDPPFFYQVKWYNSVTNAWVIMTTNSSAGAFYNYTHVVTGAVFPPNTYQQYIVLPENLVGWGNASSPILNVLTDTYPNAVNLPYSINILPKQIDLAWDQLLTSDVNGRDPVNYYKLEWDQGVGNWTELTNTSLGILSTFALLQSNIFPASSYQSFRVSALNGIGYGPTSAVLQVQADGPPTFMNTPTATAILPTYIYLSWDPITSDVYTGRDPVIYYQVNFLNRPCYYNISDDCTTEDMSLATWVEKSNSSTQLANTTFIDKFAGILKPNEIFYYMICPENGVGFGTCSDTFSFLSCNYPQFMYPPTNTPSDVAPYWIYLSWLPITEQSQTGRNPAIFYDLQWDQGTNQANWTSVIPMSDGLLTSFNHTSSTLFPNNTLVSYRLRAFNGVGAGAYSTIYQILCDATPPMMNAPSVSSVNPLWILVTWASITDCTLSGRDCPNFYGLQWDQGIGNWTDLISHSAGLTNSFNLTSSTPFPSGEEIQFRTYAENDVGMGQFSSVYTINADSVPLYMNTPYCEQSSSDVNPNWIFVTWTGISGDNETGGDLAIYYELQWDQYSSNWTAVTNQSQGLQYSFNQTVLNPFPSGANISFRLRAMNGVGFGAFSDTLLVVADLVPQYMNPPVVDSSVDINPNWIYVTWTEISGDNETGGNDPIYYGLEWDQATGNWTNCTNSSIGLTYSYNLSSPSPFPSGSSIQFRAFAKNWVGVGVYSDVTTITANSVPLYMNTPSVDPQMIYPNWMYITWQGISGDNETGGNDAVYYELQWDQGSNATNWTVLTNITNGLDYSYNLTVTQPFPSQSVQMFRSRAMNGVGLGAYSSILLVTADSVPLYMNMPYANQTSTYVTPHWIYLTWEGISGNNETGGADPVYYGLQWDQGNNSWVNLTTVSMGLTYSFNMTSLSQPYPSGMIMQFRTFAANGVGSGAYSQVLSLQADLVPQYMNEPYTDLTQITPHWISVSWQGISGDNETGAADPIYYGIEWDQGNGSWLNLTNFAIGLTYSYNLTSVNKPFPSGMSMQFRTYAANEVGFGVYSEILSIQADSVPQYMMEPSTNASMITPHWVCVTWNNIIGDNETGGDLPIYYGIEWDQAQGNWTNLTTPAIGLTNSFNLTSTLPFTSNCIIQFRTFAQNGVGVGFYSSVLSVVGDSVPLYMNAPTVDYYANNINPTWIYVTWQGIVGDNETGRDNASYYQLQWDQGKNLWVNLTSESMGLLYSYNLTSSVPFQSGLVMYFRTRAKNGVGYGPYSTPYQVIADTVPLRMNTPSATQVLYNNIGLSWASISNWSDTGGDTIIYYQVQFLNLSCYSNDTANCTGQVGQWVNLTSQVSQGKTTTYHHISNTHFSKNKTFHYRICAQNGVGMGACSQNLSVLTATTPIQMSPPQAVKIYHDQVILQWPIATLSTATGRSPITNYTIQWDNYQYYSYYPNNTASVPWVTIGVVQQNTSAINQTFTHQVLPNFISRQRIMYRILANNNVGQGDTFSNATQVITRDRYWSVAHSWANLALPNAGDTFIIPSGQNWTFDLQSSPIYGNIEIGGRVEFLNTSSILNLQANQIIVKGGELLIGTSNSPFQGQASITLYGDSNQTQYSFSPAIQGGSKILSNFGIINFYGISRIPISYLQDSIYQGNQSVLLSPGLSWNAGDKIGFSPSNMRYNQFDYAIISSYDNKTGLTTLDRQISNYQFGASQSTASFYSGVEMRGQVHLLSRNVVIRGNDTDNWGCQILTSTCQQGLAGLVGQTTLDNVEISNCSQYGYQNAALRFIDATTQMQSITNCSIHHGLGQALQIESSNNIYFAGNTIFDFTKIGVNVSKSQQVTIDSNIISVIRDNYINEQANSQIQPAGILGCLNSDCISLTITNNIVSGVSYAGFIASGHECGAASTQQIFRNNVAHSINGWGAIVFSNQQSFTQTALCVQASYFSAYKCSQGGIIIYNATLQVTFSNMILIDNAIGGTIMIGDEKNENITQMAVFQDSVIYGETIARDCQSMSLCSEANADASQCYDRTGIMISYFSKSGKQPYITSTSDLPIQQMNSDATYGGDSQYRNMTFVNFTSPTTWCGVGQKTIRLNPYGADYHPRSKFTGIHFIVTFPFISNSVQNQNQDALTSLFSPPTSWISQTMCGVYACTGPLNTYLQFISTTYSGSIMPDNTLSSFDIAPYNLENVGKIKSCSFIHTWNAYLCQNTNLAILLFESLDDDKSARLITPISVQNSIYNTNSVVNSFMNHLGIGSNVERLSRWPVLIETGPNLIYTIQYQDLPPKNQRFTLVTDVGGVTISIKYPKGGAYILKDLQGTIYPANGWSNTLQHQTPIQGAFCGENLFDGTSNTLQFYIMPNCSLWIQGVDAIISNVRLNWTLTSFYQSGGTAYFSSQLAQSLLINPSFIKIISVVSGSVIINFQITQAGTSSTTDLAAVKTLLNTQIANQLLWLGAPILNATVVGQSVNIQSPNQTFNQPYDWNATGKEVWVNQPIQTIVPVVVTSTPDASGLSLIPQTQSVQEDSSSSDHSLAIVAGVLLGVGVLVCVAGIFIYRRCKRDKDIKEATLKMDESHYEQDQVTNSGSSPLKNGDVTSFDEETHDEQYHPSKGFSYMTGLYEQDFNTVRKAKEGDNLISFSPEQEEARTGDNFYEHQPTFGLKVEEDENQLETIGNFDIDVELENCAPQEKEDSFATLECEENNSYSENDFKDQFEFRDDVVFNEIPEQTQVNHESSIDEGDDLYSLEMVSEENEEEQKKEEGDFKFDESFAVDSFEPLEEIIID